MSSINSAFQDLRDYIPTFPFEKRLSKIDTLNLAIAYINMLNGILSSTFPPEEYLRQSVRFSKDGFAQAPAWSTSDLVARLSWIDWPKLGMRAPHL
ncbi:unnamed protein product, partial [Mesorhabditis belari]|uniref:BHLH domain-containing protein n=1 Tax=Mesorhabditis belari TaxID=2138241 RepID=A0AAF3FL34_9BILA